MARTPRQKHRNARIRVLTWNTRLGIPLRDGGLRWLARVFAPDIIFLQEAVPGSAQIDRALGPGWAVWPARQPHPRRNGTYVIWRTDRFKFRRGENDDITYGEQYERRRPIVRLLDLRTGRQVLACSMHVAPLGKGFNEANPYARRRHERQVAAIASRLAELAKPDDVVIAGGDVNERLAVPVREELRGRDVRSRMRQIAHMRCGWAVLGGSVSLDDVFVRLRPFVRFATRRLIRVPFKGNDHDAVLTVLDVDRI